MKKLIAAILFLVGLNLSTEARHIAGGEMSYVYLGIGSNANSGRYKIIVDWSERFKQMMPHILNVPKFEGVRIHWGNSDKDTDGCPLVGKSKGVDMIFESRKAYDELFPKISDMCAKEDVYIDIVGGTKKEDFTT
ncbi:MAG: DUF5675 family protein [Chitinophagaceae bacterium]|nr:DUF5675 family protein [Chitinophagaceae bacterium]